MNSLLFTGASGFLGANLEPLFKNNFKTSTLGLCTTDNYNVNLATTVPTFHETFDVVLHAAGKAHMIPNSDEEKEMFFNINYQGTVNLCNALEKSGLPKAFVFISSVAVYGLSEGENITEEHPLNGDSPYALSKISAEEYLADWCNKNNIKLSIIRPALIAGPNPPGNLGTMIKAIKTGIYLSIDGGKARKSVLMVHDIARMLPALIEKGGVYNVCDDSQPSFRELELSISKQLGKKPPISIPYQIAKSMALAGDLLGKRAPFNSCKLSKITQTLTFSNEKAKRVLGWQPINVINHFKIK